MAKVTTTLEDVKERLRRAHKAADALNGRFV
jgi:hypothetical protein